MFIFLEIFFITSIFSTEIILQKLGNITLMYPVLAMAYSDQLHLSKKMFISDGLIYSCRLSLSCKIFLLTVVTYF